MAPPLVPASFLLKVELTISILVQFKKYNAPPLLAWLFVKVQLIIVMFSQFVKRIPPPYKFAYPFINPMFLKTVLFAVILKIGALLFPFIVCPFPSITRLFFVIWIPVVLLKFESTLSLCL